MEFRQFMEVIVTRDIGKIHKAFNQLGPNQCTFLIKALTLLVKYSNKKYLSRYNHVLIEFSPYVRMKYYRDKRGHHLEKNRENY